MKNNLVSRIIEKIPIMCILFVIGSIWGYCGYEAGILSFLTWIVMELDEIKKTL